MGFIAPAIAAIAATTVGATTVGAIATKAFIQLLVGVALSVAKSALTKRPRIEQQRQELSQSTVIPAYRYVYGTTEATGTPAPADVVKDGVLYGVWILNSRESAGPFTLYLDKREVQATGDPYDFTTNGGAVASNSPFSGHLTYWIGRGDQTTPPVQITNEVPYSTQNPRWFQTTDAWRGRTVVWLRLTRGDDQGLRERWPSYPGLPELTLRGNFSKVWDPREGAQSLTDATTWAFSDNQALCVLDALTQNPVAPHALANLMQDTFEWAADAADEDVDLNAGGTEKRYRVGGTLTFSESEVEEQIEPLVQAGASRMMRVSGKLGICPAVWHAPVYTLTDVLGDRLEYRALRSADDVPTQLRVTYTSSDRSYETADLGIWDIPGASGAPRVDTLDLPFVHSATQAQRVRKIEGLRFLEQRQLISSGPPEMLDVLPNAHVTVSLSGRTRSNGTYRVDSIHAASEPMGGDGVAFAAPFDLVETSAATYAWDETTDEQTVLVPEFVETFSGTQPGGAIGSVTGSDVELDPGDTRLGQIRFFFDPSPSEVTEYRWQFQTWTVENNGVYTEGGTIRGDVRDGSDDVFGYLPLIGPSDTTRVRVLARGPAGDSAWVESGILQIDFDVTINTATASLGWIQFNIDTPDTSNFRGIKCFRSTDTVFANATEVGTEQAIAPDTTGNIIFGDNTVSQLFSNAGFAASGVWTLGGGRWSVPGDGFATKSSSDSGSLLQSPTIADGATVRFGINVESQTVNGVRAVIGGDSTVFGTTFLQPDTGLFVDTLTAPTGVTSAGVQGTFASDVVLDSLQAFVPTASSIPQGTANFWLVPVDQNGNEGSPFGPVERTVI